MIFTNLTPISLTGQSLIIRKGNHIFFFQYGPFFDYLVGVITQYFIDVMIVDEWIEQTIIARKIMSQSGKKNSLGKKSTLKGAAKIPTQNPLLYPM